MGLYRERNSASSDIKCEIHANTFLLLSQIMTTMMIIVGIMKKAAPPEIIPIRIIEQIIRVLYTMLILAIALTTSVLL